MSIFPTKKWYSVYTHYTFSGIGWNLVPSYVSYEFVQDCELQLPNKLQNYDPNFCKQRNLHTMGKQLHLEGAPNGKRVTSGTIKKLYSKLSIRHFWVQSPNGTKLTQPIAHPPTAVFVCSRFPNIALPMWNWPKLTWLHRMETYSCNKGCICLFLIFLWKHIQAIEPQNPILSRKKGKLKRSNKIITQTIIIKVSSQLRVIQK